MQAVTVEHAAVDDLEALDLGALLEDGHGRGGHRAGEDAADVCVVSAGGDEENYIFGAGGEGEDGGDDGYVGEVTRRSEVKEIYRTRMDLRAAGEGGVGHKDVALAQAARMQLHLIFHRATSV